jgi:hypothetical protein
MSELKQERRRKRIVEPSSNRRQRRTIADCGVNPIRQQCSDQ